MKPLSILLAITLLFSCVFIPVSAQPWCGIQNLYFQDIPSGIDGFGQLANYASGNAVTDENITITSTDPVTFVDGYISPPSEFTGTTRLLSGLRLYNLYGYASSVSQPSYFTMNVSVYHSDGKETFFYNITSTAISSTAPHLDQTYYVSPTNASFVSTDRLLIRIGAYTTRNSATTIHFMNQGTTPTFVQSGYFDCPTILGSTAGESAGNSGIVVGGAGIALALMAIGLSRQRRNQ